MKRMLSLVLALLMLLSVLPLQAAAETLPQDSIQDSDYDGIPDSRDAAPNSNTFSGAYKSGDYSMTIQYTMDYRNFFGDNTVYNEAIADFSVWAAQFTYENEENETTYKPVGSLTEPDGTSITTVYHIDQLMRAHGMEDVIDYTLAEGYFADGISMSAYSDDDISEVYFGHHKVTYNGETIEVIAVYVRGTNGTIEEWSSNFNIGNLYRFGQQYDAAEGKLRFPNADWKRKTNHRAFDVCCNRIRTALRDYLQTFADPDAAPVFWVAGHSRGGSISNLIASYLVDEGEKVFAYTFAAPNTTANTEASAAKYDCIFNLVNGDDFVPRLPMPEWGFTRYGRTRTYYASNATNSQRSSYLGNTSYSYKSDSDLQALCNKFIVMTDNNSGGNDGWRDVYVFHCGHQHADEQSGEYRSGCIRTRQWTELLTWGGESMFEGWSARVKRYAYWSSSDNGICETPAYAMQVLAELMGNLSLGGAWDYLTTNKLADRYDFEKTSLINYATSIADPHYPENYYLIQELTEAQGNIDSQYTHSASLYTNGSGRPLHEHDYTVYYYEGEAPTCTQPGRGYKVCNCSQINSAWYDDVVYDVVFPPLDHELVYTYVGNNTHCVTCIREDLDPVYEACTFDENDVCVYCGHSKYVPNPVKVYVVDETDSGAVRWWAWGSEPNLTDLAFPGAEAFDQGLEKNGHRYYVVNLDAGASGDGLILSVKKPGAETYLSTPDLDYARHLATNENVTWAVIYLYQNNDGLQASFDGRDVWPLSLAQTHEPTCTAAGETVYKGLLTGEELSVPGAPALGHSCGAPAWTWNGYESASAAFTCARCGDVQTVQAAVTSEVTQEPTYTAPGEITYTASLTFEDVTYTSIRTETIPMLEHRLENGYYLLRGNGDKGWTVDNISASDLFSENASSQGEYLLQTTLTVSEQIKVVRVENDQITAWYPDGEGTQYTVEEDHAGLVTIYFRTDYQSGWSAFGGYFYIAFEAHVAELKINNSLSLDAAITLNIQIEKTALDALELDSFQLVLIHYREGDTNPEPERLNAKTAYYYSGGKYYYWFEYKNIATCELNDRMVMRLEGVKDGEAWVSPEKEYNPITYCYKITKNTKKSEELRITCANLILFCTEAQKYFGYNLDNLAANDPRWDNAVEGQLAVTTNPVDSLDKVTDDGQQTGLDVVIWRNTLELEGRVALSYVIQVPDANNVSDYTLVCTYENAKGVPKTVTIEGGDWGPFDDQHRKVSMSELNANDMRCEVTAVVKDGSGNVVSNTYVTSIEAFARKMLLNEEEDPRYEALQPLMIAMMNYGFAAEAFLD